MKLFLATNNPHKLIELATMLGAVGLSIEVMPPSAVGGMPAVNEDAPTFEGNARKKALALAARLTALLAVGPSLAKAAGRNVADAGAASGDPAGRILIVADDSGLCVDALDGAPGVISARFAGDGADDAANNAKLLALLRDVPPARRTAAFHCCIVATTVAGESFAFAGRCPGRVIDAPRGRGGFGYDPFFVPDGYEQTFAELSAEVKNRISHRAQALARLVAWLRR